MLFLYKKITPI